MIQFASLLHALSYKKKCPVCQGQMTINSRDLAADMKAKGLGEETVPAPLYLSFYCQNETITINTYTEEVVSVKVDLKDPITGFSSLPKFGQTSFTYGSLIQALTVDCQKCCQYGFALQIHIDISTRQITKVLLDSEILTVEKGSITYEIRNSYSMEQTRFNKYCNIHTEIILPLVTLNFIHPMETVFRIKKLIVFS